MESLRWWFLLIAAVMFSMSGCASLQDWAFWRDHPAHAASDDQLVVSVLDPGDQAAGHGVDTSITARDIALAQDAAWWGHLVPPAAPVDLSGRWIGTWKGIGLFDSLRHSTAAATLVQEGAVGVAHLVLDDTIAAGLPRVLRLEGSRGVRLVYRVSGSDAWMRHPTAPGEMTVAFTLVDGKLVGTLPNAEAPVVITLRRADR
jgi:hypothetical protein